LTEEAIQAISGPAEKQRKRNASAGFFGQILSAVWALTILFGGGYLAWKFLAPQFFEQSSSTTSARESGDRSLRDAIAIASVASVANDDPNGPSGTKLYVVKIEGTMTNDFGSDDAMCNSAVFVLIGQGRTYEPETDIADDCSSDHVAPQTKSDFKFLFGVT
jgi:hypothetical protein